MTTVIDRPQVQSTSMSPCPVVWPTSGPREFFKNGLTSCQQQNNMTSLSFSPMDRGVSTTVKYSDGQHTVTCPSQDIQIFQNRTITFPGTRRALFWKCPRDLNPCQCLLQQSLDELGEDWMSRWGHWQHPDSLTLRWSKQECVTDFLGTAGRREVWRAHKQEMAVATTQWGFLSTPHQ